MRIVRREVMILLAIQELNQRKLAEKAGISRQTLSAVMNGRSCRPEQAGKIANALGCEVTKIFDME